MLVAGAILLTVRNWASWSDKPFVMGHVEDELSLVTSTKTLWIVILESMGDVERRGHFLFQDIFLDRLAKSPKSCEGNLSPAGFQTCNLQNESHTCYQCPSMFNVKYE
jgi:hypothetical protein